MKMQLVAGSANRPLAQKIAVHLQLKLATAETARHRDGETHVALHSDVRCADVYLLQSLSPPANEHLLEALLLADACYRQHAARITLVAPYLAYTRQEQQHQHGSPIATKLLANLIASAYINRLVTLDMHSKVIEGFFSVPCYHLSSASVFAAHLQQANDNLVVVSPDAGGRGRAARLATLLTCPYFIIDKRLAADAYFQVNYGASSLRGKDCLLVDDICVSGRTLLLAEQLLRRHEVKSVRTAVTHALLATETCKQLLATQLQEVIFTDTVQIALPITDKLRLLSVAGILAATIKEMHNA